MIQHVAGLFIKIALLILPFSAFSVPVIYVNQVGFDSRGSKIAVIGNDASIKPGTKFYLISASSKNVFTGTLGAEKKVEEWKEGEYFYRADFSSFHLPGKYNIRITVDGRQYNSDTFQIGENELAKLTLPSVLHYYLP